MGYLVFGYWVIWAIYIFWILMFYQIYYLQIFSPTFLPLWKNFLSFIISHLFFFPLPKESILKSIIAANIILFKYFGFPFTFSLHSIFLSIHRIEAISKLILAATAAAKSLQSCLTLCDPIDGSPRGSPVPGILQARTLEWVAISFSNAWKWKVKVKTLNRV